MKITLLGHSGFLVEGDTACLVFDYYTDELGLVDQLPFGEKPVVFFASHSHHDHYNKRILKHAGKSVGYVLDAGIAKPPVGNVIALSKGKSAEVLGVAVVAFGSTDQGISFLVELEGRKLFHAGDLNDWYWEEESTAEELLHDEQWFLNEIEPLKSSRPDAAFFPVDARLGRHAMRGPLHFAQQASPKLLIPMHLCGGEGLPNDLAGLFAAEGISTEVALIARPGDSIII